MACCASQDIGEWSTWYCGDCGDGPLNQTLCLRCLNCGHQRCKALEAHEPIMAPLTPENSDAEQTTKPATDNTQQVKGKSRAVKDLRKQISGSMGTHADAYDRHDSTMMMYHEEGIHELPKDIVQSASTYPSPISSLSACGSETSSSTTESVLPFEDEDIHVRAMIDKRAKQLAICILGSLRLSYDALTAKFVLRSHGAGSQSSTPHTSNSAPRVSTLQTSNTKEGDGRRRSRRESNEQDDDNERKRLKSSLNPVVEDENPKLACPFYKRYGHRWPIHLCKNKSWPTTHRVKEHLYRQHGPYQCRRCDRKFETEHELVSHSKSEDSCAVDGSHHADVINRLDNATVAKLKAKGNLKGLHEDERWQKIYRAMFGESSIVPSPYLDGTFAEDGPYTPPSRQDPGQLVRDFAMDFSRNLWPVLEDLLRGRLLRTVPNEAERILADLDQTSVDDAIRAVFEKSIYPYKGEIIGPEKQIDCSADTTENASKNHIDDIGGYLLLFNNDVYEADPAHIYSTSEEERHILDLDYIPYATSSPLRDMSSSGLFNSGEHFKQDHGTGIGALHDGSRTLLASDLLETTDVAVGRFGSPDISPDLCLPFDGSWPGETTKTYSVEDIPQNPIQVPSSNEVSASPIENAEDKYLDTSSPVRNGHGRPVYTDMWSCLECGEFANLLWIDSCGLCGARRS